MSKVIKETRYCKVLKQAKIRENNVAYGIEKIFVKDLNQEEIRFVYFKDWWHYIRFRRYNCDFFLFGTYCIGSVPELFLYS